jgi:hypothetical protein
MKKNIVLVALLTAVAALLSSCESATAVEDMSLKPSATVESSSSVDMSSSITQSSSSSPVYDYYYGEMGKVCDEWSIQVVTGSQTYGAYLSMYQTCGDQVILSTGEDFGGVIYRWILDAAKDYLDAGVVVSDEVRKYGSSFHLYRTVDGGLNYFYVEPVMDGDGMK